MENHWIRNTVAIVTGGASGIGQAIAIESARQGGIVVIADIDSEKANETLDLIHAFSGQAVFVKTDVTKSKDLQILMEKASALGAIKYLANSAGIQTYGNAESTTEALWDKTMDVNLKSMFLTIREVIPEIKSNGGGGIVNISSVQAFSCQKDVLAYSTAKGAVVSMTRSLGIDYADQGISVNCICPGSVDTPMLRYGASQHGEVESVIKEWGAHHPIGRIGTPEEIAKTCLFLWGPDSNFIVGQSIVIDGGLGSIIL